MQTDIKAILAKIIPLLTKSRYKGQNGKVGVIGGSFEYTGAPYYAAISAVKGGGDLAHIFCPQEAALPIKSYSPELIVHPLLGEQSPKIVDWMPALNSLILGPGLGRSMPISLFVEEFKQPLVLDADALWALIKEQKLLNIVKDNSKNIILTPNQVEMKRIMNFLHLEDKQIHFNDQYTKTDDLFVKEVSPNDQIAANAVALSIELNNVTIIQKGQVRFQFNSEVDIITNGKRVFLVFEEGSQKRCGGIGDVLSGLTGLYAFWARSQLNQEHDLLYGCILSTLITRRASQMAYSKYFYSLSCPNVIEFIGAAFHDMFQQLQSKL